MSIPALLRQHAEDASTKWWQRCGAVRQIDTRIHWLAELDEWIEAHCDGLLEAGDVGLETVRQAHENSLRKNAADVRGDSFTLVALQVERDGESALQTCVKDARLRGAVEDFLSWSPSEHAKQAISNWSQDATHPLHGSAIRHLHIHGLDGGEGLEQALFKSTPDTVRPVLDAIAHCGREDLLGHVIQILDAPQFPEDSPIKFSAARCALVLGSTQRAVAALRQFAGGNTSHALEACQLLSLVLPPEQFNVVWQNPNAALAVRCVGWHGNPAHVPWLLQQMQEPSLRDLAKESFRQITGMSMDAITAKTAAGPSAPPSASAQPMPKTAAEWWAAHQRDFEQGSTYLCGRTVSANNLRHLLVTAAQGDRDTAALRHLLVLPADMRFPTAAHIDLQWQRASALSQTPPPQKDRP